MANHAPDSTASRVLMYSCSVTLPSIGFCSGRPRPASSAAAADLHSLTRVLKPDAEASAALMPENASKILNGGSVPAGTRQIRLLRVQLGTPTGFYFCKALSAG